MPTFNLAAEARRTRNIRRNSITLKDISAPSMLATDLYQSTYRQIIDLWTAASKSIADEYARTLSQMTTDAPADVQREIEQASAAATRLALTLTPSLRTWAIRVERAVRSRWVRQVYSATSVDLTTRLSVFDVEDTLQSYIAWNADLITNVSDEIKQRVSNSVFSGLNERRPAREVAREINEAVGLGRKRSQRIAQDQLAKISATLADQRRQEAGIEVWAWVHSGKKHPRKPHEARDGLLYSDVAANVGKSVDGKVVNAPPERGDRPGQPPYCGCRARGVLVFEFDD